MTDYAPGTVGVATVDDESVRVFRTGVRSNMGWEVSVPNGKLWVSDSNGSVRDVRPLVVLDLAAAEKASDTEGQSLWRLRKVAETGDTDGAAFTKDLIATIADQIEAQTRPPQPAEPTGLGAVVEDAKGHKYVRIADPIDGWAKDRDWRRIGGDIAANPYYGYADIDVARVLSEGVQP